LSNTHTILQLKIPVKLAAHVISMREKVNKYETNRHIKNVMSFIILKAATPYSILRDYRKQLGYMATVCQCSKQTMSKRIDYMLQHELITIEGADIRLKSWKQVATLYYLNLKELTTVNYDYTKDKDIFLRLFAAEIDANKEQQAYMIKTKLQRNPVLRNTIQATMLQRGADVKRINEFNYLHNGMKLLYRNSFIAEPDLHAMIKLVRPDCNRGVRGMAQAWHFNSAQLVSYYKAKLAAAKIAVITKGERITSAGRVRNELSHVIWNGHKKQTVLSLVDSIVIIGKKQAA